MTLYEPERQAWSDRAHVSARRWIYPRVFPGAALEFTRHERTSAGPHPLDALGVDLTVRVTIRGLRAPLSFYVQERYRAVAYQRYGDVTFTEWNEATDTPSELHKIAAGWFVYGYYDPEADWFTEWIAFDVPAVLRAVALGALRFHTVPRNGKMQTVKALTLTELEPYGVRVTRPVDPYSSLYNHKER